MSGKLVGLMSEQHDFRDDLESSLYVLLWLTLVYSECSNGEQVPSFLAGVLDPQPHAPKSPDRKTSGFAKPDFLKGRTFLTEVTFPGRPALHSLFRHLTRLFAIRYEDEPSSDEKGVAESYRVRREAVADPTQRELLGELYRGTVVHKFNQRSALLDDHTYIIRLFDDALENRSSWPSHDCAVKQEYVLAKVPSPEPVIKTGWSTILILKEMAEENVDEVMEDDDDTEELGDDYQMVDTSSEKTDSDQMTVDGRSSPLSPDRSF